MDKVFRKVLDMMIMDILLGQEAKRLKISVSPSEVDNEIAKMMKARNLTKQQFEAQLAQQKISIDEIRQNFEKSLLRQKIMGMEVGRKVVVTPAEIKAYYEAHKDNLYDRGGLHMGVLVYAAQRQCQIHRRPDQIRQHIREYLLIYASFCTDKRRQNSWIRCRKIFF